MFGGSIKVFGVLLLFLQDVLSDDDYCKREITELDFVTTVRVSCKFRGQTLTLHNRLVYAILRQHPKNAKGKKERAKVDGKSTSPKKVTYTLSIKNSNITKILDRGFGYEPGLEGVDLSDNRLPELRRLQFTGIPNLNSLSLCGNQIAIIANYTFQHLPNLKDLIMYENKLSHLNYYTFMGLVKLQHLNLNSNKISNVASGSFVALSNLDYLFLNDNLISSLDGSKLAGMNNLKYLSLKHNTIKNIWPGTFGGKPMLETLDLSYNYLRKLSSDTFRGLLSLRNLNLRGNTLTIIEDLSFSHMPLLRELDLSHNGLPGLHKGMFIGLENINTFLASSNLMQGLALSPNKNILSERNQMIEALAIICTKPGMLFADFRKNRLSEMLQNVTEARLGFNFKNRRQHICIF